MRDVSTAVRVECASSYPVSIFIAGDAQRARELCRAYCDRTGFCVTVTPTDYVYTDGEESGVIVGIINYPRFPATPTLLWQRALELAHELRAGLGQESFSVQSPKFTEWVSFREDRS